MKHVRLIELRTQSLLCAAEVWGRVGRRLCLDHHFASVPIRVCVPLEPGLSFRSLPVATGFRSTQPPATRPQRLGAQRLRALSQRLAFTAARLEQSGSEQHVVVGDQGSSMAINGHQGSSRLRAARRSGSEQHVVVGDLVAARLEPLAHLGEEGLLRLRVARQLDVRGLERVEREIDVEIALVVVTHGA